MKKIIYKNPLFKLLTIIFLIVITLIICLLIIFLPDIKREKYDFYNDYYNNVQKYDSYHQIYQLNTTNIFNLDKNRYYNEKIERNFNNTTNIKNIKNLNDVEIEKEKLIILVSDYNGLSENNIYKETLVLLKRYPNIRLYIVGLEDVSYSKNTDLVLSPINSESVYIIKNINGNFQ